VSLLRVNIPSPAPGGPSETGIITTGSDGIATITFTKPYKSKPIVALAPDIPHGTDVVTTQIEGWTISDTNYVGMAVFTGDDAGKPEANVPVHYAIWE